jgi:phenylpropionate dioxygenase-like ring-hydroxylating dioxygenase large terminal subunit
MPPMTAYATDLAAVTQPVNTARGLPNPFYIDPAVFEEEKKRVFLRNWAGLGFAKDVPEPGDALPVSFLGQPLVMVRDNDGVLRVFQNICRHRGMILIEKPGKIRRAIRCPYHSWCYELDGRLRTTPHVGGPGVNRHDDIKREQLGLIEVRSHQWLGVVFVNVDGQAPAFEDYAADVLARWAEFDHPLYHGGEDSSFKLEVDSNWKLPVENYCESYHLPWIHPGLNSYSRLEDHYHIEQPGRFSGQGTTVYRPMPFGDGRQFPEFPGLSEKWNEGAEYIALYPNVLFGVHKDHTYGIVIEPVSHEKSIEHVAIFYTKAEVTGDDWREKREKNAAMWKEIFVEDIFVVEGMQQGRHASGFDGGKFSPVMDSPTHCFHHWVATQMQD